MTALPRLQKNILSMRLVNKRCYHKLLTGTLSSCHLQSWEQTILLISFLATWTGNSHKHMPITLHYLQAPFATDSNKIAVLLKYSLHRRDKPETNSVSQSLYMIFHFYLSPFLVWRFRQNLGETKTPNLKLGVVMHACNPNI